MASGVVLGRAPAPLGGEERKEKKEEEGGKRSEEGEGGRRREKKKEKVCGPQRAAGRINSHLISLSHVWDAAPLDPAGVPGKSTHRTRHFGEIRRGRGGRKRVRGGRG